MTIRTTCRRCGEPITADNEEDLVDQVQAHGGAHGTHIPAREHILAHLHRPEE